MAGPNGTEFVLSRYNVRVVRKFSVWSVTIVAAALLCFFLAFPSRSPQPTPQPPGEARKASPASAAFGVATSTRSDSPQASNEPPTPGPARVAPWESDVTHFHPALIYDKYLKAAESGDADAQYILSTAFLECLNVPRTEDELDLDDLKRSNLPGEFIETARRRFENCKPLHDLHADLESRYRHWRDEAYDSGHPLMLMKQPGLPSQSKRLLLKQAVAARYPEPYLYAEAFISVAEFFRNDPTYQNKHREEAWRLLYCVASYACHAVAERRALRKKYHSHDYNQITVAESQIRSALIDGNTETLTF